MPSTIPEPHASRIARNTLDAEYLDRPPYAQRLEDRLAAGRALREKAPREAHADWAPAADRADPIDVMLASEQGRIEQLLPIRHGRMVATPFTFYRGAAAIMAADLARTPSTGYLVQACGDAHLLNFGAFATPERRIIFDINDFDETFPAPWEWDLKRLAASFVIASRANGHRPAEAREAARNVVVAYADHMAQLARMRVLDVWYSYIDWEREIEQTTDAVLRKRRRGVLEKALRRDAAAELVKLTHVIDGRPRIKDAPPLIFHPDLDEDPEAPAVITENFRRYRDSLPAERRVLLDRYSLADIAIKVVGVGSVGTFCAVGLFFASGEDALFLQVKEVRQSVLEPYVGPSPFESDGARVVFGQRLMQAASDTFLGHMVGVRGRHSYVRQLRDVKIRPLVELFTAENMKGFAATCAAALARAHARSADPGVISGYLGKGRTMGGAIAEFAVRYADRNELDHALLREAIREGRLDAYFEEG